MREGRKGDGEDRLLRAENARPRKQVRVVGVNRPREVGGDRGGVDGDQRGELREVSFLRLAAVEDKDLRIG